MDDMKILVICPGVSGSSDSNYMRHAVLQASDQGFRTVVVHYRGIGETI